MNIEDIIKPINENSPIGIDITYETEFLELKELRKEKEKRSLGKWVEKTKDTENEENYSVSSICYEILKRKSKNFIILSFLIEDLTKKYNLEGMCIGIEILNQYCLHYWENSYPIPEELELNLARGKIIEWIANSLHEKLRLGSLFPQKLNVAISFDDIERMNCLGTYAKQKILPPSSEFISQYKTCLAILKNGNLSKSIIDKINDCLLKIENTKNILKKYLNHEFSYFFGLEVLLNDMLFFFKPFCQTEIKAEENEIKEEKKDHNSPKVVEKESILGRSNINRDDIYEQITILSEKLSSIEPHSPVPHFILKILEWKNMSFMNIVSNLGMESPMVHFLMRNQNSEDNEDLSKNRNNYIRKKIDIDDDYTG